MSDIFETISIVATPPREPVTLIVEIGIPGPAGPQGAAGAGFVTFATTALMFATPGDPGSIAYCLDYPDQHWKWSIQQATWIPAF